MEDVTWTFTIGLPDAILLEKEPLFSTGRITEALPPVVDPVIFRSIGMISVSVVLVVCDKGDGFMASLSVRSIWSSLASTQAVGVSGRDTPASLGCT